MNPYSAFSEKLDKSLPVECDFEEHTDFTSDSLMYRTVRLDRVPERRVFYIDTKEIPNFDANRFLNVLRSMLKQRQNQPVETVKVPAPYSASDEVKEIFRQRGIELETESSER
jgi:hypothetical protein